MKKTTNTSLNDLFRAARGKAEPGLVSNEEAQDLLAHQVMHGVPSTQSMGQQLYRRLFSTPLKLGITAMTTASLITLGLLTLQPGSSNTPRHISSKPAVTSLSITSSVESLRAVASNTEPSQLSHGVIARLKETPPTQNLAITVTASIPPATTTPELPTDSLKPFDLTVDQLAQLGVTLSENGDIVVFEKAGNGDIVNRYSFPPTAGVRFAMGLKSSDVTVSHVLKHLPRLVTETNGIKRMYSFENDTSFTKIVGGLADSVQLSFKRTIAPGNELPDSNRWVKVFDDSSTAHYSNGQKVHFNIDTTLKSLGLDPKKFKGKVKVMIREDAFVKSDHNSPIEGELRLPDSVVPPAMKAVLRQNITIMRAHGQDPSNGHCDTLVSGPYRDSVKAIGDAIARMNLKDGVTMMQFHAPGDSSTDILSTLRALRAQNEEYTENKIPLDHLIPVRVHNTSGAQPNELIFWYEPTPELTNMLPKASYPYRAPVPQHLDLSVYPNPTNGLSNLHYELKDGKQANFAVHDLLGKKLLDLGSSSSATGDLKLDLSSLEAGVYLLITTTSDGERDVQRIVLTK